MRETPPVLIDPTSPIGSEIDLFQVKGKEALGDAAGDILPLAGGGGNLRSLSIIRLIEIGLKAKEHPTKTLACARPKVENN
jgi:hypothetical protein